MKPKMSAAQFEAHLKARLSMSNPTYACSDAQLHQQDFEEKRDPDERQRPETKKENELGTDTQLEKPTSAKDCIEVH